MARGSGTPSRARIRLGAWGQRAANRMGYEIRPFDRGTQGTPEQIRRAKLLNSLGVTVLLDVGANTGQYALHTREAGFRGRMVSFEPLSDAFRDLERHAGADDLWECRRVAVGSEDGSAEIHVAANSASSSLLDMKQRHLDSAPESRYTGTEEVPVARLDSIWPELVGADDRPFLKLDVQGFELEALRGAEASLGQVAGVQAELSLVPLYDGAPSFRELLAYLEERGFRLAGLEPGHDDRRSGEMLQVDGIFVRESLSPA